MNKTICLLLAIVIIGLADISKANDIKENQKGTGKIIIEEVEKTYNLDSKGFKNIAINDNTKAERDEIEKEIDVKIFKKLGVKSLQEADEKNLTKKYYEARSKYIVGNYAQNPKILFVDENGKKIKEIIGGEWKPIKDEKGIQRKMVGGLEISLNGEYLGMMELSKYEFDSPKSVFSYLDKKGNILWSKEKVSSFKLSYDGTRVIMNQWVGNSPFSITGSPSELKEYRERLLICDEKGSELWSYMFYRIRDSICRYENTRYYVVEYYPTFQDFELKDQQISSIFIDASTLNSYVIKRERTKEYIIGGNIDDNGVIEIFKYYNKDKRKEIIENKDLGETK